MNRYQESMKVYLRQLSKGIGPAIVWSLWGIPCYGLSDGSREYVLPDPWLLQPRLQFGTGAVKDGRPVLIPGNPKVPGAESEWSIGQWHQHYYVGPDSLRLKPAESFSRSLGRADYAFDSTNADSHLWIYREGHSYIYELYQRNGALVDQGGANIFLGTNTVGKVTLKDRLTFEMDVRLKSIAAKTEHGNLAYKDVPSAQSFSGFVFGSNISLSHGYTTIFYQVPLADSRTEMPNYKGCIIGKDGNMTLILDHNFQDQKRLITDSKDFSHEKYSINAMLEYAGSQVFECRTPLDKQSIQLTSADLEPAAWNWKGVYVGLEVQNRDSRSSAKTYEPQGEASAAIQIKNVFAYRE